MHFRVQILAILTSLAMLIVIVRLVYHRQVREEYALLWLLAAGTILGLSVFGGTLTGLAAFIGIGYAPSLLFAVGGVFVLLILLSQTVAISSLARKNHDLTQRVAILEWHLERVRVGRGEEADEKSDSLTSGEPTEEVLIPLGEVKEMR